MIGYVVESAVYAGDTNVRAGTARIYVATEARARELAGEKRGATYRPIPYAEMPQAARNNLMRLA